MAASIKKISELEKTNALSASSTIIIEENGKAKRFSANDIGKVKTINGIEPDESGNVEIAVLDGDVGVSSEQIMDVIEEYFEENPIEQPKDSGYYRIEASIMDGNILRIDHKASNTDMVGLPTQFVKLPTTDLPVGGVELGGVKNGGNVVINEDGTMDAPVGDSGSSVQADLNQNDENAPDFVKGRTHWIEDNMVIVEWDGVTEGGQHPSAEGQVLDTIVKVNDLTPDISELIGAKVTINNDGELVEDVVSESVIIKQGDLASVAGLIYIFYKDEIAEGDTVINVPGAGMYFSTSSYNNSFISKIEFGSVAVHQLDEKYIPESIARKSDVDAVKKDWHQNDEAAPDYIENRTHWEEFVKFEYDPDDTGHLVFFYGSFTLDKISDLVPRKEELRGNILTDEYGEQEIGAFLSRADFKDCGPGNYRVGYVFLVVGSDDLMVSIDGGTFLRSAGNGVYAFRSAFKRSMTCTSFTHTLDEKFIPDTIARKSDIAGGSGVSSWNDLTDKPFYEEDNQIIIEWDGVATEEMQANSFPIFGGTTDKFAKISDLVPSYEEILGSEITIASGGQNINVNINNTPELADAIIKCDGAIMFGEVMLIAYNTTYTTPFAEGEVFTVPSPGVYVNIDMADKQANFIAKIAYGSTIIKKLDSKFLPDDILVNWSGIVDKPFGEVGSQVVIEWDGNTEGRDQVALDGSPSHWYKASDLTPTEDELSAFAIEASDGTVYTEEFVGLGVGENMLFAQVFAVFYNTEATFRDGTFNVPSPGIYFMNAGGMYVAKFSYGSTTIKKLDEKFLPDNIPVSWENLKDKPFGEEDAGVTIEWDDSSISDERITIVGGEPPAPLCKVSNLTPDSAELIGAAVEFDGERVVLGEGDFGIVQGQNCTVTPYFIVMYGTDATYDAGSTTVVQAPSPGLYGFVFEGVHLKLSYGSTTIKTLDEKFIPDTIARKSDIVSSGNGGAVSWNDLLDKPFGSTVAVIEWDGNTEGRDQFILGPAVPPFYKISDLTPSDEELGDFTAELNTGDVYTREQVIIRMGENVLVTDLFFVFYDTNASVFDGESVSVPSTGVYTLNNEGTYISKLSYGSTKTIETKYLPDTIARVSDIERITVDATFDNPTFTSSINMGRKTDSEVGYDSVAIGRDCVANLDYCVAIGDTAEATNYSAIAIGADVVAGGMYSHAGGYETDSLGYVSYTEGAYTKATGDYSHAEGCGTIASTTAQHVQGKYNLPDEDSKYLHIVGNGESDSSRSNAHTVDKDGNGWFAGAVEGTALILKAPNGTRYQITVDNNGTLSTIEIEQD